MTGTVKKINHRSAHTWSKYPWCAATISILFFIMYNFLKTTAQLFGYGGNKPFELNDIPAFMQEFPKLACMLLIVYIAHSIAWQVFLLYPIILRIVMSVVFFGALWFVVSLIGMVMEDSSVNNTLGVLYQVLIRICVIIFIYDIVCFLISVSFYIKEKSERSRNDSGRSASKRAAAYNGETKEYYEFRKKWNRFHEKYENEKNTFTWTQTDALNRVISMEAEFENQAVKYTKNGMRLSNRALETLCEIEHIARDILFLSEEDNKKIQELKLKNEETEAIGGVTVYGFYTGCGSLDEIEKRHRQLAKIFHTDNGLADEDMIKIINYEYEEAKRQF